MTAWPFRIVVFDSRLPSLLQELAHERHDALGAVDVGEVRAPLEPLEPRAGQEAREALAVAGRDERVLARVEEEERHRESLAPRELRAERGEVRRAHGL